MGVVVPLLLPPLEDPEDEPEDDPDEDPDDDPEDDPDELPLEDPEDEPEEDPDEDPDDDPELPPDEPPASSPPVVSEEAQPEEYAPAVNTATREQMTTEPKLFRLAGVAPADERFWESIEEPSEFMVRGVRAFRGVPHAQSDRGQKILLQGVCPQLRRTPST
jgi:hypothetical protein